MKRIIIGSFVSLFSLILIHNANAWHLSGLVECEGTGAPLAGVEVLVSGTSGLGPFADSAVTDSNGAYEIALPDSPGNYCATLNQATLPSDAVIVSPASVPACFATTEGDDSEGIVWVIRSATCQEGKCWFTGGGAKFNPLIGPSAEHGPHHSFGGNVYPGCNPDSGDGGSWNHVAHRLQLHFHGQTIRVVRCGNVTPPPPPGSTSPVTPFNFIEFEGTGTLKGIKGNKTDYGTVCFFARAEDRNEPGSNGAKDGALIDRYFLHVFDCSSGATLLLVEGDADGNPGGDGDPATVHPVKITDGNFQLHISSCDDPPSF